MKISISILSIVTVLLCNIYAIAADKVVVIPIIISSPTGDALASDVLEGKTFSSKDGAGIPGTMMNKGAGGTITPGALSQTLGAGYWSSQNDIQGDEDLKSTNIRYGVTIFNVEGRLKCDTGEVKKLANTNAVFCATDCDNTYPLKGFFWQGCLYGCSTSNISIFEIFDNNCE